MKPSSIRLRGPGFLMPCERNSGPHDSRRLMLGQAMDAARAAYEVGYESPSQFSREYRRLFGNPPARDIARLKDSPMLAG